MLLSHKIALHPNNRQRTMLSRTAGCARFAYNWALSKWKDMYEASKADPSLPKPNKFLINKTFNLAKKTDFPWMLETSSRAPMIAIQQVEKAFRNFFAKRAKYPRFRKKGIKDRFSVTNDSVRIDRQSIHLPKIGKVKMLENPRFDGKLMSVCVSKTANRWHISLTYETELPKKQPALPDTIVGIDLGLTSFATLSNGTKITNPRHYQKALQRLKRCSRSLSRKQKGSKNRQKAKARLAKQHARIANLRNDALHKLTSMLTQTYAAIGIENLDVKQMQKNKRLSRSVSDASFFEFKRQLTYKADMAGTKIAVADKYYPISKTCSNCKAINNGLKLSDRRWTCKDCGSEHDRDINAAINLRNMAAGVAASACGGESSGGSCKAAVKLAPMKQEAASGEPRKYGKNNYHTDIHNNVYSSM